MPIDKITAAQFATEIVAGINNRNINLDTAFGPIPDTCVQPQAAVFENQNDRVRQLSLMLTLSDPTVFAGFEQDLEGIVFNETMTRILGAGSSAVCLFIRKTPPPIDAPVQRGFPIGSEPDASSGSTATFVTTQAAVMPVATAASFFNNLTQQYELAVPVISVVQGSGTIIGPNQIDRPLRALGLFDRVTNPSASQGGRDAETNAELINRYLLAIIGTQTGVAPGIEKMALADFPEITSLYIAFGTNPLLTRGSTDGGAVDAWVQGSSLLQITENQTFLGVGQLVEVSKPPVAQVIQVSSGATVYTLGSDYVVTLDSSGVSGSTRAADGVTFLPGGPNPLPAPGGVVTVTYASDNLIVALQGDFQLPDALELGRDLLFRRGVAVPIVHAAVLTVLSGFSTTTVLAAVQSAVLTYINGLGLGQAVQGSDIQQVVRAIDGVDNYVITRLTRSTVPSGTADINLAGNEYPTLAQSDLSIALG